MTQAKADETGTLGHGEWSAAPELDELLRSLEERRFVSVGGLWGSAQALVIAALAQRAQGPWLVQVSTDTEADAIAEDLELFGAQPLVLPSRDTGAGQRGVDLDSVRRRLQAAQRLTGPGPSRPRLLVASVLSLLQPLPNLEELERARLELRVGDTIGVEHLMRKLVQAGYVRQPLVERPGEISLRGDILDVFPFAHDTPLRIELFDEEIESLRTFDTESQTSIESHEALEISLAAESEADGVLPIKLLSPATLRIEIEPLRVEDKSEGLRIRSGVHQRALLRTREAFAELRHLVLQSLPATDINVDTRSVQSLDVGLREAPAALRPLVESGQRVSVLCRNAAEEKRFRHVIAEAGLDGLETCVGNLTKGFRWPALQWVVVNHRELTGLGSQRKSARTRPVHKSRVLQSFFELKPGDYVVHAVHGLALYHGLERMARGAGEEEHLHLEFADEVRLYVPACRIDLVQRYIGSGSSTGKSGLRATPKLDKIGGQSFRKRREKVERALFDLAAELLEVQAKRELRTREPWQAEEELLRDLVESFPYADTGDQALAYGEISADLGGPRPMDRLLCGDVGFGKTEIAVRAAFRVAAAGGQVAILVPTTVLAHQHLHTFQERLAEFPVEVGSLSRNVTGKAARATVERVGKGEIDILIGTHRLLSKDVHFKKLGLVIIDEEQRFGVTHKEHFKALRAGVDLLTLSATPIPRTLHMSLSGVRDISAISEPPPGRQEIETVLADAENDDLIREALLREKSRGGQVFFMHNRVHSIEGVAARIADLAPECSIIVGHGQMGARELERVMDTFTRGEADILVATTIVENGLDIPAAGTIFIDNADHFGLAELHQLRGRVGRGQHKAWCYLLVPRTKPVKENARERLKALEEMNQLGAGFQISMKDLEIRGAGNILGPEQSGHIAAVGYDMYCRLLKQCIERMRQGLPVDDVSSDADIAAGVELELGLRAFLPSEWIRSADVRLEILRQLDAMQTGADVEAMRTALRDRFGRLPAEAETLVRTFELRRHLLPLGITRLAWHQHAFLIEYRDRVALEGLRQRENLELRNLREGVAHLVLPSDRRTPQAALDWLEGILHIEARDPKEAPVDA